MQVSLAFAVAVVTNPEQNGVLTVHLADFSHNAKDSHMADVVDHTLSNYLQPGNGTDFINSACTELRAALLTQCICEV